MSTNRWSRQVLPTSSNLTAQDRSERRLSRLSPSDFESILNSDKTIVIAARDESLLGRAPKISPEPTTADDLDEPGFPLPNADKPGSTSSNQTHLPPPLPPTTPDISRRRSVNRSGATASSPDLAGARRKAERRTPPKQVDVKGKSVDRASPSGDEGRDLEPPPTPTKDHNTAAFASPSRERSRSSVTISPTRTRAKTNPAPADGPAPIFAKLSMPADLSSKAEPAASSSRISNMSAYVHVDKPSEELRTDIFGRRGSRDTRYDSVASLALDSSPKRRKAGLGAGDDPQKVRCLRPHMTCRA